MSELTDAEVKKSIIAQALERLKSAHADIVAAARMVEFAAIDPDVADINFQNDAPSSS